MGEDVQFSIQGEKLGEGGCWVRVQGQITYIREIREGRQRKLLDVSVRLNYSKITLDETDFLQYSRLTKAVWNRQIK